jgi:hypothetical protein
MSSSLQSRLDKETAAVASLDKWKLLCKILFLGTTIFGPLTFLGMVGGGSGANTGGVFPAGGIILLIIFMPLLWLLSGFALWFFVVESRVVKARLVAAKEEASKSADTSAR